jgi:hypothetical protein
MENFYKETKIEFEDNELNELVKQLSKCFENNQNNFCNTCYCVYKISNWFDTNKWHCQDKNNYWHDKYSLLGKFGFDRTAISRLSNCYTRFMVCYSNEKINVRLTSWFENFSPAKLYELLKLSEKTLCGCFNKELIKPTMTVKEIRTYIKSITDGKDKTEKVLEKNEELETTEEEIPMAYNPKLEYEFNYFETKTKSQLLNMIWELQKEYQKIKKGSKNNVY